MLKNKTLNQFLGFNPERFRFAMITASASIISLFIAYALHLEHPQWSAMTVWASTQFHRENLLEKSWWRLAGTISGVIIGVALIYLHQLNPVVFIVGLASWLGLCSGLGQLQKGFVAYGTLLAGYSAVMVSMLSVHQFDDIFSVAWDRLWTILVGVLTAILFSYFFTPKRKQEQMTQQKDKIDQLFYVILHNLLQKKQHINRSQIHELWQKIITYDELLESNRIGWLHHRKQVMIARQKLMTQAQILLHLDEFDAIPAFYFPSQQPTEKAWKHVLSLCPNGTLKILLIQLYYAIYGISVKKEHAIDAIKLHQDRIVAWHVFIRSFITISCVGFLWLITQWSLFTYLTLGLSVMLSLFASLDYPAKFMKNIFIGQCLGTVSALSCTWLLWPFASSSIEMIVYMIPVIVIGILIFSYNKLVFVAFDYIMISLILLQPSYPISISFLQSVANGLAIISAPLVASISYYFIYPSPPRKRYQNLLKLSDQQFKQGIKKISQGLKPSSAQLMHRLIHGMLLAKKNDHTYTSTLEFFKTRQGIWFCLLSLRKIVRSPSQKRALKSLELQLLQSEKNEEKTAKALQLLQRTKVDTDIICQLQHYLNKYDG